MLFLLKGGKCWHLRLLVSFFLFKTLQSCEVLILRVESPDPMFLSSSFCSSSPISSLLSRDLTLSTVWRESQTKIVSFFEKVDRRQKGDEERNVKPSFFPLSLFLWDEARGWVGWIEWLSDKVVCGKSVTPSGTRDGLHGWIETCLWTWLNSEKSKKKVESKWLKVRRQWCVLCVKWKR